MNVHRVGLPSLSEKLAREYASSPRGERTTALHLFGVVHADELSHLTSAELEEIAVAAGLARSFGTELRKMVKLARYVVPKTTTEPLSAAFARVARSLPTDYRFDREEANAR